MKCTPNGSEMRSAVPDAVFVSKPISPPWNDRIAKVALGLKRYTPTGPRCGPSRESDNRAPIGQRRYGRR